MSIGFQVTFDAADPWALARFWAELLGYRLQPPPSGYPSWEAWAEEQGIPEERRNDWAMILDPDEQKPRVFFQRVPEPKTVKNRTHLDLNVGGPRGTPLEQRKRNLGEAAARAVALGATHLYEMEPWGEYWITLADPEGNEFCMQ